MNEFVRPSVDWYAIAPVIAVFGAGLLIVTLAALTPRLRGLAKCHLWVALAGLLTAGGFMFPLWHHYTEAGGGAEQTITNGMAVDGFAIFLQVVVLAAAFCAVLISWGLAIVGTLVILKVCDVIFGVRVSKEEETEGLDLSMHGEEGYNLES